MDDGELRALVAAQSAQIAELLVALRPQPSQALPLADLYARYEKAQRERPGWRTAASMLARVVKVLGARDARTLAVLDWAECRDGCPGLAPSSRNYMLAKLKAMLRWAVAEGRLIDEPALCRARDEPQKDHRETAPTEADNQLVLDEVRKPRERVVLLCAIDSGMRRNEIRQLQWSWIGHDGETIAIPNWAAKGGRGRVVPTTYRLYSAIRAMPRVLRSPYVLPNPETGEPYAREMFTKWARDLVRAAGIQPAPGEVRVRLHDLRHGYATNAVERGVRIEVVSEILGHASLEQTRAYVQRRPGDLKAARAAFEAGIARDLRR